MTKGENRQEGSGMEFCEKLQELRKRRGLTQEELAEALYVSRTAVSRWESGRGYPGIDSLKEISRYFSVSIDDLLSAEKVISIAEKENASNIQTTLDLMIGMMDLLSIMLILLPLYPRTVDGFVYAVNLFAYTEASALNRIVYWVLFTALVLLGVLRVMLTQGKSAHKVKGLTGCSMTFGAGTVFILALAGETYAVTVAFLLLSVKGILIFRKQKRAGD